ncbi:Adenylate kinase isoenzyme 5 [Echinococcus granulosus]|uniref:Adenylate kinase isoenzyme 5 n=1 Tax=Echinococcus granulosus TaxID=6210 RepID=W6UBC3_ECHGR|nr:Adenylate kinase isoenzyme 5 [Echinococcus granulosus]EUB58405.1 Adenylate kinase isoenzyme 5 [Echinococcus granulosus]
MYHRPVDPIQYLQECLEKIKRKDYKSVRWDLFLEGKRCPLPPLALRRNSEPFSRYQPMVGTGCSQFKMRPQATVICIIAAPGIGAREFSGKMLNYYPSFVHISMGDLAINCAKIEERKSHSRWSSALRFIKSGDLAPEDMVLELLKWNINQYPTCEGFIIDGYPRTFKQYEDLKFNICKDNLSGVILIDASEEKCLHQLLNARQTSCGPAKPLPNDVIRRKICTFKNVTLPVCKVIDNESKLRVVDGERKDEDIERELLAIFDFLLTRRVTAPLIKPERECITDTQARPFLQRIVGCPGNPPTFNIPIIRPEYKDLGRQGGPGSGRTKQALSLCQSIKGAKHYNLTDLLRTRVLNALSTGAEKDWDVVAKRVHSSEPPLSYDRMIPEYWDIQIDILRDEFVKLADNATLVVVEGYMNDESQISTFNKTIGGADMVVLLDCEEETLITRLNRRCTRLKRIEDETHIVHQRVSFFKQVSLPVVRYFDELGKLVIMPADRDAELITRDLVAFVEYFLAKRQSANGANNNALQFVELANNSHSKATAEIQEEQKDPAGRDIQIVGALYSGWPDFWTYFIIGPPTCGTEHLARRLATETNFTFASIRNAQEKDYEQAKVVRRYENEFGRIEKSLTGGIAESTGFVIVGSPNEVLELLQNPMKTNSKVRILVLGEDKEAVQKQCLAKEKTKITLGIEAYTLDPEATKNRLAAYYRSVELLLQNDRLKEIVRKVPVGVTSEVTYDNLKNYVAGR